jgi:hypothetical protein
VDGIKEGMEDGCVLGWVCVRVRVWVGGSMCWGRSKLAGEILVGLKLGRESKTNYLDECAWVVQGLQGG